MWRCAEDREKTGITGATQEGEEAIYKERQQLLVIWDQGDEEDEEETTGYRLLIIFSPFCFLTGSYQNYYSTKGITFAYTTVHAHTPLSTLYSPCTHNLMPWIFCYGNTYIPSTMCHFFLPVTEIQTVLPT